MIYLLSSGILVLIFMFLKKSEKPKNFLSELAITIISYECFLVLVAGIMTVIHIPVDVNTISIINLILIVFLALQIYKKKCVQQYFVDTVDLIFVSGLFLVVLTLFLKRFSSDLLIMFDTNDPGVHLKMALNFINNKAVNNMYLGQVINGLFIESLENWCSGVYIYKPFIIQCGINLFMAGYIFWASMRRFQKGVVMRLLVYAVTLVYTCGYPYSDMLFGFVYLQLTVSVVAYLFAIMQQYLDDEANIWWSGGLLSLGCLGVGIGYTLFAPIVFVGVLCCSAYKAWKEKWLFAPGKKFYLSKKFVIFSLYVFLIPTVLIIWFLIIKPRLGGSATDYGTALGVDGYIYRNLYSDFVLYIVPAVYGVLWCIKKKEINLYTILFPLMSIYWLFFLVTMLSGKISTYYFYKLNYLVWLLILGLFVIGMKKLLSKERMFFACIVSGMILLNVVYHSGMEYTFYSKNPNYIPYMDTNAFFRINEFNKAQEAEARRNQMQISQGLVEISEVVNEMQPTEMVIFAGTFAEFSWFKTFTNQEFPAGYSADWGALENLEKFINGEYGNYAVISKSVVGIESYQQFIEQNLVYNNEYAYLIKKN